MNQFTRTKYAWIMMNIAIASLGVVLALCTYLVIKNPTTSALILTGLALAAFAFTLWLRSIAKKVIQESEHRSVLNIVPRESIIKLALGVVFVTILPMVSPLPFWLNIFIAIGIIIIWGIKVAADEKRT